MIDNTEFEQLDKMLARPALIADHGFSQRVAYGARKLSTARRNLFLITGFCWLSLLLVVASLQVLYADLSTLALAIDLGKTVTYMMTLIQFFDSSTLQSPYMGIIALLFPVAAVVSMKVRI